MKSSKAQIHAKFHRIPAIRFEDQELTFFSGFLIFQLLLKRLNLKQRLKSCFSHMKVFPSMLADNQVKFAAFVPFERFSKECCFIPQRPWISRGNFRRCQDRYGFGCYSLPPTCCKPGFHGQRYVGSQPVARNPDVGPTVCPAGDG